MYSIHLEKSTAHAVSAVRKTRLLYFDRRRGVWLQNRSWDAAQAGRHALDRQGKEHTSELQSRGHLVCRLLLEKKKNKRHTARHRIHNKHDNLKKCPLD